MDTISVCVYLAQACRECTRVRTGCCFSPSPQAPLSPEYPSQSIYTQREIKKK